jgi:hypothetical protein
MYSSYAGTDCVPLLSKYFAKAIQACAKGSNPGGLNLSLKVLPVGTKKIPASQVGFCTDYVGMILDLTNGGNYIIVHQINFFIWVSDAKVVDTAKETGPSIPEYDGWFIVIADQIVVHSTIGMEKEQSVEDGPFLLAGNLNQSIWSEPQVWNVVFQVCRERQDVVSLVFLLHSLLECHRIAGQ